MLVLDSFANSSLDRMEKGGENNRTFSFSDGAGTGICEGRGAGAGAIEGDGDGWREMTGRGGEYGELLKGSSTLFGTGAALLPSVYAQ